ncbi:MAG: purine-binding chemotaxis protein CheW [Coprococcus sp.]|nr:purine-binding chemotaxis protein CheW [Coprococcus sp.]
MSADTMENITANEIAEEGSAVPTERFLTFTSDGLSIGISTNYVIEIITDHSITMLPLVPDYVKGVINLRGQIIPIIDIRLRMGKPSIEYTGTTCIIVLDINATQIGIIVDAVQQVMDINQSLISPVPVENQLELINGMVSSGDRSVILFLDCEKLVQTY